MSNYIELENGFKFHPGYYLKELLEENCFTVDELASQLGLSDHCLTAIVEGTADITEDIATKISSVLGTSKMFWINLQHRFDGRSN